MSAAETRERMLAIAVEMIDTGGEASVRTAVVCERAGVTDPVLYYHFGNRDGLVVAAQTRRFARYVDADIEAWDAFVAGATSVEGFRSQLEGGFRIALRNRGEARSGRLDALGSSVARPVLHAALMAEQDRIIAVIAASFEEFRRRGWFREDLDVVDAAAWMYVTMLSRGFVDDGSAIVDLDRWDDTFVTLMGRMLFDGDAADSDP